MYCEFEACRTCCQTYITTNRIAKCMNNECEKQWTRKFLVASFTKKFINHTWKQTLETIGLEKEKALLPATQSVVEQQLERERISEQINEIDRLIRELYQQRANLNTAYHQGGNARTTEKKHFVRACPDEHCRGFLSTQWKCGLCDQWTCTECHVVKGPNKDSEHTCNPNDLETAKLLDKDTKPCPKCATGIYKIEGCDQMWCTQCHTAFSWRTGRIETHIHNPHYYEWQRRNNGGVAPRNVGDFQCGREITHYTARQINDKLRDMYMENNHCSKYNRHSRYHDDRAIFPSETPVMDKLTTRIDNIVRSTLHVQRVQMPTYQIDPIEDNVSLRVDYLRNRISEEEFKIKIQRANKQHQKKREIGEIIHLFVQSTTDILYRVHDCVDGKPKCKTPPEQDVLHTQITTLLDEINTLVEYTDECFVDIATTYGCKQRKIRIYNDRDRYRDVLVTV